MGNIRSEFSVLVHKINEKRCDLVIASGRKRKITNFGIVKFFVPWYIDH